jgi:outer membrane protein assembly factor BamB
MGDCYFHSVYWNYRGMIKKNPIRHDEIRRSEDVGVFFQTDNKMQKCVNGTTGIFYYEFDLLDKKELRKKLHGLVDEVLGEKH